MKEKIYKTIGGIPFIRKYQAVLILVLLGFSVVFFSYCWYAYQTYQTIKRESALLSYQKAYRNFFEISSNAILGFEGGGTKPQLARFQTSLLGVLEKIDFLHKEMGINEWDSEARLLFNEKSLSFLVQDVNPQDSPQKQLFSLGLTLQEKAQLSMQKVFFSDASLTLEEKMLWLFQLGFLYIPDITVLMSQGIFLPDTEIFKNKDKWLDQITYLEYTIRFWDKALGYFWVEDSELESVYIDFSSRLKDVLFYIRSLEEKQDFVKEDIEKLMPLINEMYSLLFRFWDTVIDKSNAFILDKKNALFFNLGSVISISLFLFTLGASLGFYFIRQASYGYQELYHKIYKFAHGDFSLRIAVDYEDEIGKVCVAYNKMADYVEHLINDLKKLLDAIRRFGDGDFSVRVKIEENSDSEVTHVALSFNQMAESFGSIITQLRELGINLAISAEQITDTSKQQEVNITDQEATTREISVTAHEILSTAKEFANTVDQISQVAEETAIMASSGKENLGKMEEAMRQMVGASQNIASKLAILNEKAGNITNIITTITKVADQTNLLSLSASIEAEKAGEYGRSFSAIAREIRRLADLVAFATLDIEKIVAEIMSAVSSSVLGVDDFTQEIRDGVSLVSNVGGQLSEIIERVQSLNKRFDIVNQGMRTQAKGADQINEGILNLNRATRDTSNSLASFRHTLQGLAEAANDIKDAVDRIKKHSLEELTASLDKLQSRNQADSHRKEKIEQR